MDSDALVPSLISVWVGEVLHDLGYPDGVRSASGRFLRPLWLVAAVRSVCAATGTVALENKARVVRALDRLRDADVQESVRVVVSSISNVAEAEFAVAAYLRSAGVFE